MQVNHKYATRGCGSDHPYFIVSGAIIGTKTRRPKPLDAATETALSPTSFFGLEFARSILTPVLGEEALMDKSLPQYKALWWMVFEDPAKMMTRMMVGNETQSSLSSTLMMIMQCYTMALLYFSTNQPNWVSSYDFLSEHSICDWGELSDAAKKEQLFALKYVSGIVLHFCAPCGPSFTHTEQNSQKSAPFSFLSFIFQSLR
jgi:hypothetical protein